MQGYLSMLRATPEQYRTAQSVSHMFHFALSFLYDLLHHDLAMPYLYEKIKRAHTVQLSYKSTVGILTRARIAQQLKDDLKLLLCKFLDIKANEKMIDQLRAEAVSDGLVQQ